ncbi:6-bladed beta-propeller [Aliifodinibius sp. S!AR15-10]|uniref:6-bladed beta-propeller n=1 Tax=Aliifodinibius sp. S!AR15-10 TaxID=2950437 RepID=UPI002865DA6A|nr:6-bladed beta-propeller [Aliifodinibius sp. S!AR15-10]MDR8393845.1 6-bladed beta-propeller [Aliifodinibius sp. S!AR15-10]
MATVIVVVLSGCLSESAELPKTKNATLNELLQSAPSSVVHLNNITVDTLFATEKHTLANSRTSSVSPTARLGRVTGLVKEDDTLYVADSQQGCIWAIDRQGNLCRKIGRSGRGPGEFGSFIGLKKNSHHLYTLDVSNARIQIFDSNFNLQTTFSHVIHAGGVSGYKSISITDSLLYMPASGRADSLITAYRVTPPFDSLTSFYPRLIPRGMQPGPYNSYQIDSNKQGEVVVSNTGLPYIFFFNSNQQLKLVIYVKFPEKDIPGNPSVEPIDKVARNMSEAISVKRLIGKLYLADDRSLYFTNSGKLYHLTYNAEENEYRTQSAKFFTFRNPQKHEENPNGINPTNMTVDEDNNTVYLGSIFNEFIYQFNLH